MARSKSKTGESAKPASLGAIVLAAGASSRMGRFKPLLPLGGVGALERSISVFRDAGIENVVVVLGCRANDLRPVVEGCGAQCIENPQWRHGMYSSVVVGARALAEQVAGAFVLPADTPLVRSCTVLQLADVFKGTRKEIVYPMFAGRRGHPPLIGSAILRQIAAEASGPLSAVLSAREGDSLDVPVADEAIHLDMDCPRDFEALQAMASQRDIPSEGECAVLLAELSVPDVVIRHSRAVADTAVRIADALIVGGINLDRELVRAGGLLHDIAKGQPHHAEAGASFLRRKGMERVAEVVEAHTEIHFQGIVDEGAIVYLADKLVAGESLVTLDERFRKSLERFADRPDALAAVQRRKTDAERIALDIESTLNMPIAVIVRDRSRLVSTLVEIAP